MILSMGWEDPIVRHDRFILERKIIPFFVSLENINSVLFVGCGSYTKHYEKWFAEKRYWTIDSNPLKKLYGAKNHIIGSMTDLDRYFSGGELDLIICNGVFGWGLNDKKQVEAAFEASFRCLRNGGVLVLGWDDTQERRPFPLQTCESLARFQPYRFAPLATSHYTNKKNMADKHVFDFYEKRSA